MQNVKDITTLVGNIIRCAIRIALLIGAGILATQIVTIIGGFLIALICIPLPFLLDPLMVLVALVAIISGVLVSSVLAASIIAYNKSKMGKHAR